MTMLHWRGSFCVLGDKRGGAITAAPLLRREAETNLGLWW